MENINDFDNFILSLHNTNINEGKISDTMGKISDRIESFFGKGEITIGKNAEDATKFNRYDIVKIIRKILPTGKDRFDSKSKIDFMKDLDNKFLYYFGLGGIIMASYAAIPGVKEFIDSNFGKENVNTSLWLFWLTSVIITYIRGFKNTLKSDIQHISFKIEYDKRDIKKNNLKNAVTVDFDYLRTNDNKNSNNILYNAFVRKMEEYKSKEGFEIDYGKASMYQNTEYDKIPKFSQQYVTLNFYPVELLNLMDDFAKEIKESSKKNNKYATKEDVFIDRRDTNDLEYYPAYYNVIMEYLTMKQVLDLADRISKLKLTLNPIPTADYNEVNKRRNEKAKNRRKIKDESTQED